MEKGLVRLHRLMSRSFGGSLCSLVIGSPVDERQIKAGRETTEDPGGEQKLVRAAREPFEDTTVS